MAFDSTYAENADRALKCRDWLRRQQAKALLAVVLMLLITVAFGGLLFGDPIRWY